MKFLFFILLVPFFASAEIELNMMHTKPVCDHPEAKSKAWCTLDDRKAAAENAGMEKTINEMIDRAVDPAKAFINVAYFSFSNKTIAAKLCEKTKQGIKIEFFLDSSYRGTELVNNLTACIVDKAKPNLRFHFLGTMNPWRLHHNKFLMVEPGDGSKATISFSSGNLSSFGTSLHFDHWVNTKTDSSTSLYKTHLCVVKAVTTAIDPNGDGVDEQLDDPMVYRSTLEKCLAKSGTLSSADAIKTEKIAPFFSPNPQNTIAKALISEIHAVKTGSIRGAMQHFLHNGIADALKSACGRGVDVSLIMDNDVVTGESEVDGVKEFFQSNLEGTCIKINFMETNAEIKQMMHNKFLILGDKRVFAGAGHFTYAGMTDNYENFYLMEDANIQSQYDELFKFMSGMAITQKQAEKK